MTKYACSESKLTALGDAIRDKAGTTDKMTLDEMATAVEGISTGYELAEGLTYYTAGESVPAGDTTTSPVTPGCGANVSAAYASNATTIGNYGFYKCTNLTSVDLPNATTIGKSAFDMCRFTSIDLPNATTIGETAFRSSSLTSIDLPNATSIGASAFESCYNILVADLGKVKTIGSYAFRRCTEFTTLIIRQTAKVVTEPTGLFYVDWPNKSALTAIYVPDALVDSYKSDWSSYADKIKPLSEYEG